MIYEIDEKGYDRKLELSDWRYSAAAVGMIRYFQYHHLEYEMDRYELRYHSQDVGINANDKYFSFVEDFYYEELHHTEIERILQQEELKDEEVKLIQTKLTVNSIMKKVFKDIKYTPENAQHILDIINQNRQKLIAETYRYLKLGYSKYANPNLMRSEDGKICRLSGYHVDAGRKTKPISYNFDTNNYNGKDAIEFDFIPFGFSKGFESVFINNNHTIEDLVKTNNTISEEIYSQYNKGEDKKDIRQLLFLTLQKGTPFIDYDVEIILKDINDEYYKTLLVQKDAIQVFTIIDQLMQSKKTEGKDLYQVLNYPCRLSNGEYLPIMKIVCEQVLNKVYLDSLLHILFKDGENNTGNNKWGNKHFFLIRNLIQINQILYLGGNFMEDQKMKSAYGDAAKVVNVIKGDANSDAKLRSYRQKLISCLVFKNYDRFIEIVLQLSSYTQVSIGILYDLAENFEQNKNLAYAFVNRLENFADKNNLKGEE